MVGEPWGLCWEVQGVALEGLELPELSCPSCVRHSLHPQPHTENEWLWFTVNPYLTALFLHQLIPEDGFRHLHRCQRQIYSCSASSDNYFNIWKGDAADLWCLVKHFYFVGSPGLLSKSFGEEGVHLSAWGCHR